MLGTSCAHLCAHTLGLLTLYMLHRIGNNERILNLNDKGKVVPVLSLT